MQLCVQTLPFDGSFEEVLSLFAEMGVEAIDHKLDPDEYLDDEEAQRRLRETLEEYGVELAVLSGTGNNPLHPQEDVARREDRLLRDRIRLAEQLGIDTVTSFSGLPGGSPEDTTPNWNAMPIPTGPWDEIEDHQWEVAIEYWEDLGEFAASRGVDVAIEIHVNTLISNPVELTRLRSATANSIGADVDPAHFVLQRIDPVDAVRHLADHDAVHHVEASDVEFYDENLRLQGVNDMTSMRSMLDRSWTFRTAGYGQSEAYWKDFVLALQMVGYDGSISVQQLRTPLPPERGVPKALAFLEQII